MELVAAWPGCARRRGRLPVYRPKQVLGCPSLAVVAVVPVQAWQHRTSGALHSAR